MGRAAVLRRPGRTLGAVSFVVLLAPFAAVLLALGALMGAPGPEPSAGTLRYGDIVNVIDAAKGAVAVLVGFWVLGNEWQAALALTATIVGHIWPVQLSFHGGKGAATGLGGMLVLDPVACLALLGVGAVSFALTTDFFRSGLIAIGLAAPALYIYRHDLATVGVVAVASFLCLIINHPVLDAPRQPGAAPRA